MAIRLFVTGGTFDKEYNEIEEVMHFRETHVPEMLDYARNRAPVDVTQLMLMDSLDMTDKERGIIADAVLGADEERIIITHGTGTMVESAQYLAERVEGKTVVLTGAMIPYKLMGSDAYFNLGAALGFVQGLPHGVYIAMNGRYFTHDNCRKNTDIGEFEELA